MNLLHQVEELGRLSGPLHLAIGVFDGLHLGHAEVIEAACVSAREKGGTAVVVTFDPHPVQVLAPSNAPRLLTSTRHQIEMLGRNHGIAVLGRRFDLPGLGEFPNFRMYAAHPVANGHEGHGWRFLVAFEK